MLVVVTEEAERNLEAISDHIAKDSPVRAAKFIARLLARCEQLKDIPYGFPIVPRFEPMGIRRRVYLNYLIFYRITAERIEILHILHGAQDYEPLLFLKR